MKNPITRWSCLLLASLAIAPAQAQVFQFATVISPAGCANTYTIDMTVSLDSVKVTNIYFDDGVTGSFAFEAFVSYQNTFSNSTLPPGNFFTYEITVFSDNPNLSPQSLTNNASAVPAQTGQAGGLPSQNNPTYNASAQSLGLVLNGVYNSPSLLAALGYDSATLHVNLPCLDTVVTSGGSGTLPVLWSPVRAEVRAGNTTLSWQTSIEQNNAGFYIEQSREGATWRQVAFVASKAAGGNSDLSINYLYTLREQVAGRLYYRVIQRDFDGRSVSSNIVTVMIGEDNRSGQLQVFPNPASHIIASHGIPLQAPYSIHDSNGRVVLRGIYQGPIDVSVLRAGSYSLQAGGLRTQFVVMRSR